MDERLGRKIHELVKGGLFNEEQVAGHPAVGQCDAMGG